MDRPSALLLAGGTSRRMGQDKASLDFGGKSLLARVVGQVLPVVDQLILVLAPGQGFDPRLVAPNLHLITDPKPHLGPLYAISQAFPLVRAGADRVLVLSCDLPFLTTAFIGELLQAQEGNALACACNEEIPNPLLAVYRRDLLAQAKPLFKAGREDARALLEDQNPKLLKDRPEARGINSPEAYQAALQELGLA
ncbi:MAG: molybdenum cofactor guanylyltransferase [bacterium]|nr:molybdenum cofactor guanylyltransferase [bacterium]